ncbi:predicted protein [Botrytis cinerea T4]|uniref:Uncharacterized protein n=1 Tax=Botryotinia fuckeliana (strain T4) TaxID=999810 RepID=G2YRZ0_BOTF4|nr:predicted protein [Botrytis cinerea T4]
MWFLSVVEEQFNKPDQPIIQLRHGHGQYLSAKKNSWDWAGNGFAAVEWTRRYVSRPSSTRPA